MTHAIRLSAVAALALGMAACTPAADDNAEAPATSTTIVEAPAAPAPAPVVVEREVAVPSAPIVIERERPANDSTTVRATGDGIEVETTNR